MAASTIQSDESVRRRGPNALALAYAIVLGFIVILCVALAVFGDPHAGDPVVRVALAPHSVAPPQTAALPRSPGAEKAPELPPALVPPNISQPIYAGRAVLADPSVVEQTKVGPLPRIASDGRTPMAVYAMPAPLLPGHAKIAIVITGLGISAKSTAAALAALPPGVTLGFAPYSDDAQRWVGEARRLGHEVLLELPMEPYDFPDSDPGPHTLRAGVSEDSNNERLQWALTRATGYTGVTNLLGSRLLSDSDSLTPIMTYLSQRGLLFYDNGSATHSVAPDVAARVGMPFAQSASTIDSIQTAMEIDKRLSDLEKLAHAHGSAAGTGFLYPVTVQRVAQWAATLSDRGFVLVPASEIVSVSKSE